MKDDSLLKLEDENDKNPMKPMSLELPWLSMETEDFICTAFQVKLLINPLPITLHDVSVPVPKKMYVDKKCIPNMCSTFNHVYWKM